MAASPLETPRDNTTCPSAAVATDGLRFSITPKRSAPTEPLLLTFLAINQLTTMAAPFTGALFELPTVNSPKMSAFGPDSDARALVSNRLVLPLSSHPARRRAGLGQWNLVIRSLVGEGGLGAGQRERLRRSLLAQLVWQYRGVYLPGQDHSMFAVRCHATG